jgi:hypothetical protein
LVPDYKDISDRYDRQLVMDDMLIQSMIKQAVDKAINFDNDPDNILQVFRFQRDFEGSSCKQLYNEK